MNKKLIAATLFSAMAISISAAPVLEKVVAYFNPAITYSLDGENILEGQGGLVYDDSVYIPVRAVSEALGISVDYIDGKVVLGTSPIDSSDIIETIDVSNHPLMSTADLPDMKIIDIDSENKTLIVAPVTSDVENPETNYIIHVTEYTSIAHYRNKLAYRFEDLELGQIVDITTCGASSLSLPPQTVAIKITLI